jgi:flagellar biosynthesis/type III secretory pathway protein FliH
LKGFEIRHTLRGGNREADRLANQAMDQGMAKGSQAGESSGRRPGKPSGLAKEPQQAMEGFVKGGVIHLLDGELPEGTFVKIIKQ